MIDYRVEIEDPHAHLFRVTLTVPAPAPEQVLALPVWIPGSYMVREFARHLSGLTARQGWRDLVLTQRDKTTWVAHCEGHASLVVSYRVYAFDGSVRGAFLDGSRGFFNGTAMFLRVDGRETEPQRVAIGRLPASWQVATAMQAAGARRYVAADYAELIDHPFELGAFWRGEFEAGGVEHEFVVSGAWPSFDGERLLADARKLCTAQIRFWHGRGKPPFARYVFLLHAAEDGYGGLEHRASTALAASRRELPRVGRDNGDGYNGLLGLISHEYFHAWNVKRLQPRELAVPDLARENPSRLLWFFEGFTSYYDDLLLLRAGLLDRTRYLRQLAKPVNALLASPGRRVQSVASASFDAWTKYYRPDENSPNATISYYHKGALVALLCDLTLRARFGASLDEAMTLLWRRAGGGVVDEAAIFDAISHGDVGLRRELLDWVDGTAELPLAERLAALAVAWREEPPSLAAQLGLKLSEGALSGITVKQVLSGSAAESAGVAAGDELLAVDGWRIRRLDDARQWLVDGAPFALLACRDQRLLTLHVRPARAVAMPTVALAADDNADAAALALRRAWLGG